MNYYLNISVLISLFAIAFVVIYYIILKKKNLSVTEPSRLICGILAIIIAVIGIFNIIYFTKSRIIKEHRYSIAENMSIVKLNDEETNNVYDIYAQYYGKDEIPGYNKVLKSSENCQYTAFISSNHLKGTNDNVTPDFIIFAEYVGEKNNADFYWKSARYEGISDKGVQSTIDYFGEIHSEKIMIIGQYGYDIEKLNIKLAFNLNEKNSGSDDLWFNV